MSKDFICDYMEKVWNQKKVDEVDRYFSKNAKIHSPMGSYSSTQAMKEIVSKWLKAIPDMYVKQLNLIEEGNFVVSHWEANGTQQQEVNNHSKSQKPVQYQGTTLYRIIDGKIVEYWAFVDCAPLRRLKK